MQCTIRLYKQPMGRVIGVFGKDMDSECLGMGLLDCTE